MKLILLGAPGAGKGTQAEIICQMYSIPVIGTGNLIREEMRNGTQFGIEAKAYMDAGRLVPDDIVISMLKERLLQDDCKKGYILDGFPRTVNQAEALTQMGIEIDQVIELSVSDEDVQLRLGGRRICSKCGATYHVEFNPSSKGDLCEKCGAPLTIRKDDNPQVIAERLKIYHQETEPIKEYYLAQGKLQVVQGQEEVATTTRLTLAVLEAYV